MATRERSMHLVVPCYNEAARLPVEPIAALLTAYGHMHLVLVDDGSTDATAQVIQRLAERFPGRPTKRDRRALDDFLNEP